MLDKRGSTQVQIKKKIQIKSRLEQNRPQTQQEVALDDD